QPFEQSDIVPETLRIMKRVGVLMHPEALAIWEPAVASALPMLTPEEWTDCVRFLERLLAAATARKRANAGGGGEGALQKGGGRNTKSRKQSGCPRAPTNAEAKGPPSFAMIFHEFPAGRAPATRRALSLDLYLCIAALAAHSGGFWSSAAGWRREGQGRTGACVVAP